MSAHNKLSATLVLIMLACDSPSEPAFEPTTLRSDEDRLAALLALDLPLVFPEDGAIGGTVHPQSSFFDTPPLVERADEVVYERRRTLSADGDEVESNEIGEWSLERLQQVSHPDDHLRAEGVIVDEVGWLLLHEDGSVETGHRVTTRTPLAEVMAEAHSGPTGLSVELLDLVESDGDASATVRVSVAVEQDRLPALPVLPHPASVSPEDYALARDVRRAATDARAADFHELTAGLVSEIEGVGGHVEAHHAEESSLVANVPVGALAALAALAGVQHVTSSGSASTPSDSDGAGVPLGDIRGNSVVAVQAYWDAGFKGQYSAETPVFLGILETTAVEDEACFARHGATCTSAVDRIRGRFNCGVACSFETNFADSDEGDHATIVASIAAGDYTQSQAAGFNVGVGLPGGWEAAASGFGTEIEFDHFRSAFGTNVIPAYACATDQGGTPTQCAELDVTNQSNGTNGSAEWCSPASQFNYEAAVENAFDSGLLPVVITHNDGDSSCYVRSPADIPKAFAVGAVEPNPMGAYSTWPHASYSAGGPADIKVGLSVRNDVMSIVDLVAPGFPTFVTDAAGTYGTVRPGGAPVAVGPSGTSWAGPQVAAAALLVKQWFLDQGVGWIDSVGRLHAVMLAMGDRGRAPGGPTVAACVSGNDILCGSDNYMGFGRLKLRMHNYVWMRTLTQTSSTDDFSEIVFGVPLPTNAFIVKCVMQQREDMVGASGGAGKVDISNVGLTVRIRNQQAGGGCAVGAGGAPLLTRSDYTFDDKHLVAVLDSEVDLSGKCVEVTYDAVTVSSAGSAISHTYCEYDNVNDE